MRERSKPKRLAQVLARNVRSRRVALGLSQEKFAELCGLHRTYVGAIERAERNSTLSTLEALAGPLSIRPWELLKEDRRGG
jgi:transcriptional regulator with XRE-family HTH domain